ncbi:hypothetical protein MKEN_00191800 [Mycena kentingensis (nom. inval.)]|nr:hypothetical protein MKEN_00191800 [Mycena kentingensis (nom. inval.)]
MPSIFDKTPQEHADAYSARLDEQCQTRVWKADAPVAPGYVKVEFFFYRHKVRDGLRPDIEAVVPLEKSGALSLYAVNQMWGLESSLVIDSERLRLGFSSDPNTLSPNTVKTLLERYGSIKLIEPYASAETHLIRGLRGILLSLGLISSSYLTLASTGAKRDVRSVRTTTEPYLRAGHRFLQKPCKYEASFEAMDQTFTLSIRLRNWQRLCWSAVAMLFASLLVGLVHILIQSPQAPDWEKTLVGQGSVGVLAIAWMIVSVLFESRLPVAGNALEYAFRESERAEDLTAAAQ